MNRFVWLLGVMVVAADANAGGVAGSIGISGFTYTPATITIEAGETLDFAASGFHPLKFDDFALACTENCQVSFRSAGSYGFHCSNHGGPGTGMAGTVTVIDSSAADRVFADPFQLFLDGAADSDTARD